MGRLALIERIRVIKIYNRLQVVCNYKYQVISRIAKNNYGIEISARGVRSLLDNWLKTKRLADHLLDDRAKILISNAGILAINNVLLKKPCLTAGKLKKDLRLVATTRTICRAINLMGWRKVQTKYCQIVRPVNRLKRFIFACLVKRFGENFDDAIVIDECTVELRIFNPTNWRKDGQPSAEIADHQWWEIGKKPKHNVKVHLFGGISRKGLLPLITFGGIMYSKDYQNWLSLSVIPFIRQKSKN
jgi:hypothetical protein